jgi:hypothetical protein
MGIPATPSLLIRSLKGKTSKVIPFSFGTSILNWDCSKFIPSATGSLDEIHPSFCSHGIACHLQHLV